MSLVNTPRKVHFSVVMCPGDRNIILKCVIEYLFQQADVVNHYRIFLSSLFLTVKIEEYPVLNINVRFGYQEREYSFTIKYSVRTVFSLCGHFLVNGLSMVE